MKYITRKRKLKTRYELTNGECFYGVHFWKWSLYVGKKVKRLQSPLKAIKDVYGNEKVTTI